MAAEIAGVSLPAEAGCQMDCMVPLAVFGMAAGPKAWAASHHFQESSLQELLAEAWAGKAGMLADNFPGMMAAYILPESGQASDTSLNLEMAAGVEASPAGSLPNIPASFQERIPTLCSREHDSRSQSFFLSLLFFINGSPILYEK